MRLLPPHAALRPSRWRLEAVPIGSTLAGSAMALLPVVATDSLTPPFGLLMLLAWRLLRSGLWHPWIGLPLGLADDLLSGNPIGSAMALWTATLLVFDLVDRAVAWRDHWVDWVIAANALMACTMLGWMFAGFTGGHGSIFGVARQAGLAILCYPAAVRLVAFLDRWRLRR